MIKYIVRLMQPFMACGSLMVIIVCAMRTLGFFEIKTSISDEIGKIGLVVGLYYLFHTRVFSPFMKKTKPHYEAK